MRNALERLIERHILKARAQGQLTGLAGEGKPLPEHPEAAVIDAGEAVAYRMMAEAGALPREIELGREITKVREDLALASSDDERKRLMVRLSDLSLRQAIEKEARIRMMTT